MKRKSIVKLAVTLVVIVLVALLALFGMPLPGTNIYSVNSIGEAVSLGMDLRGGIVAEYAAADTSVEDFDTQMTSTVSTLATRLTNAGFSSASVSQQGSDRVRVEIRGADDYEEVARLMGTTAHLEFLDPDGNVLFENAGVDSYSIAVADQENALYGIACTLTEDALTTLSDVATNYSGQQISVSLDGEQVASAAIDEVAANGQVTIASADEGLTSDESYEWASDMVTLLQSGALSVDMTETETRVTSVPNTQATRGAAIAGAVGLILIIAFMIAVYRLPGVAAGIGLCVYTLIVLYAVAIFGTQLTLPGLVGILLGIGMAVGADVIVFERFREELTLGRTPYNAVQFAFRNARGVVLDANVVMLIAAIVMLIFTTGAVRSFAATLLIGIIAAIFTSIVVTRSLLKALCNLGVQNRAAYTR